MFQRFISGGLCIWIVIALFKTEYSGGNEFHLETAAAIQVECAESQQICLLSCTEIRPEETGVLVRWSKVNSFGNHSPSQPVAAWDRNPANPPYSTGRFGISSSLSLILHNVSKADAGIFNCSVDRLNKDITNCYNKLVVRDTSTTAPTILMKSTFSFSALPSHHPTKEIHHKHDANTLVKVICIPVALLLLVLGFLFALLSRNSQTNRNRQHCKEMPSDTYASERRSCPSLSHSSDVIFHHELLGDTQVLVKHSCSSLDYPSDVIYHDNQYLVADTNNNRISAIDPVDQHISVYYKCKGNTCPFSLAALSASEIIFTCSENKCILGIQDQTEYTWAKKYDEFQRPTGMVVHDNSVFVADNEAGCIHVFDRKGTFRKRIGKGNLSKPEFLAVNSRKRLFVTDSGDIKIFSTEGRYLRVFRPDENEWKLGGIATDEDDILYVAACQDSAKRETVACTSGVFVVDPEYHTTDSRLNIHSESSCILGLCVDSDRKKLVGVDHDRNLHVEYPLFAKLKDHSASEQWEIMPLFYDV